MIKTVENFIINEKIQNKTVVLGFSTGPDSCALALILNKLKEKYSLNIVLAYFNHGWREEAKEEEIFTKEFALQHNFNYEIKQAPKNSKKNEETARNLRYSFFEKVAKKYKTNVVFLAHNKNDNIETLIYRIIKGTSIKGLNSIPQKREIYYRPLLEIEKKEILTFLKKNKQEYRIDSSNDDVKYKRNLIRHKILPLFEEINPNYSNNIEILIKNSISAQKIIDENLEKIEDKLNNKNEINYEKFISLKEEYRLEFLNRYLKNELKNRDYKTLLKLDNFISNNTNSKTSLNSNSFLKIHNNKISIEKKVQKNKNELIIKKEGLYNFENIELKIEKITKKINEFPNKKENFCYLNFNFPLTLRYRKNGDKFTPCGLNSKNSKLKDYLINQKIQQQEKDKLLLLCKENEVLWILGDSINDNFKIKNSNGYKVSWRKNG